MMKCKHCGSSKVKKFVYGYVDPNGLKDNEIPGGCVIMPDAPKYFCEDCQETFGHFFKQKKDEQ
jgi:hypothetical protein